MDMETSTPQSRSIQARPPSHIQIPPRLAKKFLIQTVDSSKSASQITGYMIQKVLEYNEVKFSTLKYLEGSLFVQFEEPQSAINLSQLRYIDKYQVKVEISVLFTTSQGIIFSEEALYTDSDKDLLSFIQEKSPQVVQAKSLPRKPQTSRIRILKT